MAAAHCAAELRKRGGPRRRSCWSGESRIRRMSGRRSRRSTCAGESKREDAFVNGGGLVRGERRRAARRGRASCRWTSGPGRRSSRRRRRWSSAKALIATGARVNILHHLEGARLEGIHYLRVLGNSDAIREEAAGRGARGAHRRQLHRQRGGGVADGDGDRCTMVMLEDVALSRAFGEEVGRYFHEILESHGIELVDGRRARGVPGGRAGAGDPDEERAGDRGRRGRGRGRGAPGDDARRAGRPRGGQRDRLRLEARDLGGGDLRGRRRVLLRQRDARAAAAGRALGRGAAAGAARGAAGCWGSRSRTGWCRTSSATWPTGRAWSTWGRRSAGTSSCGGATATPASSASGTWTAAGSRRR